MSPTRIILASLWHHRRIHLSVAAGVAVATAVITGALLVGDSVRGSLRELAIQRLGRIDSVLVAQQPFRAALAQELTLGEHFDGVAPLLVASGSLASTGPARGRAGSLAASNKRAESSSTSVPVPPNNTSRRATQLSIIGCQESFWLLDDRPPPC